MSKRSNTLFWVIAVLTALTTNLQAMDVNPTERYNFTTINMEEGLPNNFIDDLLKDSEGFLWVATNGNGVARYDSYEFISFNRQSPPDRQLHDNFVHKLCEDRFKRLWVASESGIELIDMRTLRLTQLTSKDSQWEQVRCQPSHLLYVSEAGNLWMATGNVLYKVIFDAEGNIERIIKRCNLPQQEAVQAICEINGYLWINYALSIYRLDESDNNPQTKPVMLPAFRDTKLIVNAFCICGNEIWMAALDGLYRYDLTTELIRKYLPGRFVTDVVKTDDHTIVASMLTGLELYEVSTDSFLHIDNATYSDANNAESYGILNCNFINCLLGDNDIVWIGTEAGGLSRMCRPKLITRNYVHSDKIAESIARNPVNAIYEDKDGLIWVGTVEGGLNCLDPEQGTFTHYTTAAPTFLSHNSVSCFTTDGQDRLWIGTWGGGFGWIDRKRSMRFHHVADRSYADIPNGLICAICYDACNNYIWLTTPAHIYYYDLKTQQLHEALPEAKLGGIGPTYAGYCIDRDSCLWLGLTAGLCQIDLRTVRTSQPHYRLWRTKLDEPTSNLKEKITFIHEASNGTIWIGSNGYGIYKALPNGKGDYTFRAYNTRDGLVDNAVRGILEDNEGNIWVSTINGLSCYNPTTNQFHNYTRKDGLANNQFYWNAACRTHNGELYWGSIGGLSSVKLNLNYREKEQVPLKLTGILVSGRETLPQETLTLHERDKNLQFKFAALDFDPSNSVAYSYRLKGAEDQWTELNATQRTANYTNLYPGKYTFELKYSLDGKTWMPEGISLPVVIRPYFYRTLWFKLLTTALLIVILYGLFAWRIRLLKQQRQLLQIKVNERTAELEEQKRLLSAHTEELSQQNILLTHQNEKIERQKAELVQMSQKIQEMTVDKLAFFTNITHEFRTPLTLIVGPIKQALRLSHDPQVIEQLHFVERNSSYLIQLINQLMDFRKVEAGKMKVVCNPNDLSRLLDSVLPPFRHYASDRGIDLRCFSRLSGRTLLFDEDALYKVLTNLISNALKFTPTGGRVSIYAATVRQEAGVDTLYIGVRDTGTGIVDDDLEKVFDQFYQSKNQVSSSISGQSGTGIGLYICKHLIQLHQGRIWVKNNVAGGCTFRILLPLKQAPEDIKLPRQVPDAGQEEETPTSPNATANRLTILVVEDNQDMRGYIRIILSEHYNVLEAANGQEALETLQHQRVDFIVSDLMMPVMDGMELSRRVKASLAISHIPFLMLTAKTSNETRIESFKIGVDEYLLKPFDDELLLTRIANILESRRKTQQRFAYDMDIDILCTEEESYDKKFLKQAMQTVKENYRNAEFEIDVFVRAMHMSRSVVYRKIQSLTGQSIGNFIRNYRLNIARELLLKNSTTYNLNVSEIAYEVGFNDPKYFTRCFTKHFQISPSKLMEKGKQG